MNVDTVTPGSFDFYALATTYGDKKASKKISVQIKKCTESEVYVNKKNGFHLSYK